MTISSTTNRVSYAGDGGTTVFSYPHRFLEDDDLLVIVVDDSTGAETEQTLSTDYTVSGAGDDNGGSITFTSAPASGKTIVILNDPDITQGYDPEDGSALAANSLETAFDRLTLINQRQSDQIGRAFRKSDGDTSGAATVLPVPVENRSFKYVSDGNGGLELGLTDHDPDEAQDDAEAAKTAAETAQAAAETAESNAEGHETGAETAKTGAETAKTGAETAETNAQAWAEGTEPGGAGTKSAKEWAEAASPKFIGEVFALQTDVTGVAAPSNDGAVKYIELTAGLTGAGQQNEGLLTSESVSGSSPKITATAVIDHADSPMNGQTIHLINTEERFLRAGNAGTLQDDQDNSVDALRTNHQASLTTEGSASIPGDGSWSSKRMTGAWDTGGSESYIEMKKKGNDETRPRNIGVTHYMRIA